MNFQFLMSYTYQNYYSLYAYMLYFVHTLCLFPFFQLTIFLFLFLVIYYYYIPMLCNIHCDRNSKNQFKISKSFMCMYIIEVITENINIYIIVYNNDDIIRICVCYFSVFVLPVHDNDEMLMTL